MEFYNKHYITIDERNRIVDGFSDAFRQPSDTDICINEQGGYQFRLFPGGAENPCLFDWPDMIPLYKWENGEVVHRTEEEIEADRVKPLLSPAEQREEAYNTLVVIEWHGDMITVTQASQLWQYYAAEGSLTAGTLQTLIADAKAKIREMYPD